MVDFLEYVLYNLNTMNKIKILKYGIFDSKKNYPSAEIAPVRRVQHFEFDFILSCSKQAISNIGERSCKLSPNMLVIRKPGQTSNSHLHFKCYCLHLEIDRDNPLYSELLGVPEYLTLINETLYHTLFETLFEYLLKKSDNAPDYFVLSKIFELMHYIKKDAPRNITLTHRNLKQENHAIQEAVKYIKANFSQNISLEVLGAVTGYSPNHFRKLFTEIMETSPQKYLERIRINHAKYLLIKRETSLADIAYACGFSSQPYFTKIFKAHTLLTPYEFQQKSMFRYAED